jgi:hypothetical protein
MLAAVASVTPGPEFSGDRYGVTPTVRILKQRARV